MSVTGSRPTSDVSPTDAEVSGQLFSALPTAVEQTCGSFDATMEQHMSACGISTPHAENWYAQRRLVAICERLTNDVGDLMVERLGRFLPTLIEWPDTVETLNDALESLDTWYDTLHRNHSGGVRHQPIDSHEIELAFDTPYPAAFECGLVRGVTHRFRIRGAYVRVHETDTSSVYTVSW